MDGGAVGKRWGEWEEGRERELWWVWKKFKKKKQIILKNKKPKYGRWRAAHTYILIPHLIPSKDTNQSICQGQPITQKNADTTDKWCVERNGTWQPQIYCLVSVQTKGLAVPPRMALLCFESGLTLGARLSKSDNCLSTICSHYLYSLYVVSSSSSKFSARHVKTKPSHVLHGSADSKHKAQANHLFITTYAYFK